MGHILLDVSVHLTAFLEEYRRASLIALIVHSNDSLILCFSYNISKEWIARNRLTLSDGSLKPVHHMAAAANAGLYSPTILFLDL